MQGLLVRLMSVLLMTESTPVDAPGGVAAMLPLNHEVVQCEERENADLDGDGQQDLVCITRTGEDEPQRITVALSSAPTGSAPALDTPILHCPKCSGALPTSFDLAVYSQPPGSFSVSESGGSSSTWTLKYSFQRAGPSFRLTEESQETHDRNTDSSEGLVTQYKEGVGDSVRTVSQHDTVEDSAGFLNVYALPLKGSLNVDGDGTEPAWKKALRLPVDRAAYTVLERSEIKSNADLSYAVRALWDDDFLYLLVEVTDDALVFTPPGKNGVRYDHLELWFDRALPWGRMQPDPEKTFQLGLIPVQGGSRVRVVRWFPDEVELPQVKAAYHKSKKGYVVEARFPLELIGASEDYAKESDYLERRKSLVNMTVIASDTDTPKAPRQEKMLATSRLKHRGAPFEMGLLHMMKSARPDDLEQLR